MIELLLTINYTLSGLKDSIINNLSMFRDLGLGGYLNMSVDHRVTRCTWGVTSFLTDNFQTEF